MTDSNVKFSEKLVCFPTLPNVLVFLLKKSANKSVKIYIHVISYLQFYYPNLSYRFSIVPDILISNNFIYNYM